MGYLTTNNQYYSKSVATTQSRKRNKQGKVTTPPSQKNNLVSQISRKKTGENTYTDCIDGNNYEVTYSKNGITIKLPNNTTKHINYEQLFQTYTPEQKTEMINFLRTQNAAILADFATETCTTNFFPEGYNYGGYYIPSDEHLNINPNSFNHELMHALDNHNNDGNSHDTFSSRLEYIKTVKEEFKAYTAAGAKFVDESGSTIVMDSTSEFFAECAAFLTSGGKYNYNKAVIEKYFPKSMALTKKYIEEARKMPQSTRRQLTAKTETQPDGTIDCTRFDKQGKKKNMTTFDPSQWPYTQHPYKAVFNESGDIVEETTNELYNGNVIYQTYREFNPKAGTTYTRITDKDKYTGNVEEIIVEETTSNPFSKMITSKKFDDDEQITTKTTQKFGDQNRKLSEEVIFYDENGKPTEKSTKNFSPKSGRLMSQEITPL
ncbi:hypothetical protein IJE86_05060 [bacterium]|nr:hypothetical protein [bacterium]